MKFDFPDREMLEAFGDMVAYSDGKTERCIPCVFDKLPAELVPGFEGGKGAHVLPDYKSRVGELILAVTCLCEDVPCPSRGHTFTICKVAYEFDRVLESDGYVQSLVVR